jgi:DNA polymerase III epsilon subunit-like protein
MKILVVDCETTGLPISWDKPATDVDNWPRIIQIAFELFTETGVTLKRRIALIKPDNWEIPDKDYFMSKGESEPEAIKKAKFWIDNGFETAISELAGEPLPGILKEFATLYDECDLMLCHNVSYDKNVISSELIRYKVGVHGKKPDFCTKLEGEQICKLPSQYPGKYKWPRLDELYRHLFGKDFDGAHDAGCDIQATKECYLEIMLRREYESI